MNFFRLGGEAIEGVKLFDYYINESIGAYIEFEKRYKERFQKSTVMDEYIRL